MQRSCRLKIFEYLKIGSEEPSLYLIILDDKLRAQAVRSPRSTFRNI